MPFIYPSIHLDLSLENIASSFAFGEPIIVASVIIPISIIVASVIIPVSTSVWVAIPFVSVIIPFRISLSFT